MKKKETIAKRVPVSGASNPKPKPQVKIYVYI